MSRKKKNILIENLEITGIAAEGKSLGRHEGKIVFVKYAAPGDVADVMVIRDRKKFMEGYAVSFKKYSDKRAEPFCEHFGMCGGCTWQHIPYEEQLKFKQQEVSENLQRIGKVELPETTTAIGSKENIFYRNKLEFTFLSNRWLTKKK
jgi:23S rRNA (uracil1939-C5)-methyltransferase